MFLMIKVLLLMPIGGFRALVPVFAASYTTYPHLAMADQKGNLHERMFNKMGDITREMVGRGEDNVEARTGQGQDPVVAMVEDEKEEDHPETVVEEQEDLMETKRDEKDDLVGVAGGLEVVLGRIQSHRRHIREREKMREELHSLIAGLQVTLEEEQTKHQVCPKDIFQ
jgi:hypothetical protein